MSGQGRLKIGNLVSLKSGGPIMTVNTLFEDGGVQCVWHLADGSLLREGFYPAALKLEREKPKPAASPAP